MLTESTICLSESSDKMNHLKRELTMNNQADFWQLEIKYIYDN